MVKIYLMSETTSEAIIQNIYSIGLPEQIIMDNGLQFVSTEFESYCNSSGIRLIPEKLDTTP